MARLRRAFYLIGLFFGVVGGDWGMAVHYLLCRTVCEDKIWKEIMCKLGFTFADEMSIMGVG